MAIKKQTSEKKGNLQEKKGMTAKQKAAKKLKDEKQRQKELKIKIDRMIQQCIDVIQKEQLIYHDEMYPLLPFGRQTFYNYGLEKVEAIKECLENNKLEAKRHLRKQWRDSENPTSQIALYKLLGSDDECHRLNGSKREYDLKTGGKELFASMSDEELKKRIEFLTSNLNE